MNPVQEPITGKEAQEDLSSAYQTLVQFYRAFNSRDIKLMAENWMQSDEITMDNPLGCIKRGWNEINAVYERIFNGPASVYVEFYDYTIHETPEVFYAVGRERDISAWSTMKSTVLSEPAESSGSIKDAGDRCIIMVLSRMPIC